MAHVGADLRGRASPRSLVKAGRLPDVHVLLFSTSTFCYDYYLIVSNVSPPISLPLPLYNSLLDHAQAFQIRTRAMEDINC